MYNYRMHGCVMSSDIDLFLPMIDEDTQPELVLRRSSGPPLSRERPALERTVATVWNEPPGVRYYLARSSQGFQLHFDGWSDFELSHDLTEATWSIAESHPSGFVSELASGPLTAFRLNLAGHLVLHASAVRARGRGLAFVGDSGMGKSTTATLLCAGGAELLTDDIARVDLLDGRHVVWPGCAESRLRPNSVSLVAAAGPSAKVRQTGDGRTAVGLPFWDGAPVPLEAVVVPIPSREQRELHVQRLGAADGLKWLLRSPRIAGWTDTGIRAREFSQLGTLARQVPVYLAVLPWGPPFDARVGDELLDRLGWA